MESIKGELERIVVNIWDAVLSLEAKPTEIVSASTPDSMMTACVQITGEFEGAVTLHCPSELMRDAARAAGLGDNPSIEEMRDILAELANITGGNVKSHLPAPAQLSLPSVVEGSDYRFGVKGSRVVESLGVLVLDRLVVVTLLERQESRG